MLHHLGEPTEKEMREVEEKVKELGAKVVIVAGDISEQSTSTLVRLSRHSLTLTKRRIRCRDVLR